MDGAGSTCDTVVEEIAPGGQLKPVRHMYEKAICILEGQVVATEILERGRKKHTLEWQKGSSFSTPINAWHQHFNAQGKAPVRMVCSTDAPVIINRYRNLDYIFNNNFVFYRSLQRCADSGARAGATSPRLSEDAFGSPTLSRIYGAFSRRITRNAAATIVQRYLNLSTTP